MSEQIKYYCDYCGRELERTEAGEYINWGSLKFTYKLGIVKEWKHLCENCWTKIDEKIERLGE